MAPLFFVDALTTPYNPVKNVRCIKNLFTTLLRAKALTRYVSFLLLMDIPVDFSV